MNYQRGFSPVALIIILAVLALGGSGYYASQKVAPAFWFRAPTNFDECVEATRGLIIETIPEQCEFRGQTFVNVNDASPTSITEPEDNNIEPPVTQPTPGVGTSILEGKCAYSESGELVCGTDLILVIAGKEIKYEAYTSIKIEPNKIISIGKVDPRGIFIKGSVVLFCPRPGVYELNEETSKRAVGNCLAN